MNTARRDVFGVMGASFLPIRGPAACSKPPTPRRRLRWVAPAQSVTANFVAVTGVTFQTAPARRRILAPGKTQEVGPGNHPFQSTILLSQFANIATTLGGADAGTAIPPPPASAVTDATNELATVSYFQTTRIYADPGATVIARPLPVRGVFGVDYLDCSVGCSGYYVTQ